MRFFAILIFGLGLAVTSARADLLDKVRKEYPRLTQPGVSDFEKVQMIVDYAYRNTPWAYDGGSEMYRLGMDEVNRVRAGETSLEQGFQFFADDRAAVSCGGVGHMARILLEKFGYDAWYLSAGFYPKSARGSDFTHVVVLAKIRDGDREVMSVHDPTTNGSYTQADGKTPMDYFEMLGLLWKREASEIDRIEFDDGIRRQPPTYLMASDHKPSSEDLSWRLVDDQDVEIEQTASGWWRVVSPRPLAKLERAGDDWWHKELRDEGWPGESLYILAMPFEFDGRGADEMMKRAREAIAAAGGPGVGEDFYPH